MAMTSWCGKPGRASSSAAPSTEPPHSAEHPRRPMRECELAYGRATVRVRLPADAEVAVYAPADLPAVADPLATLRQALSSPLDSPPLPALAHPGQQVAIVIDDLSRPAPTAVMLQAVLEDLETAGVRRTDLLILCAVGLHRPLTPEELRALVGPAACDLELLNHDPHDPAQLQFLTTTSLGTPLHLNRRFVEADLKILTGDVEYHQFVGYGGGAKSVYPGIADAEAIRLSHSRMELPGAEAGEIDGNPVRREIDEAGRAAGVDFVLQAVLNSRQEVVGAFAGDLDSAFRAGAKLVDAQYLLEIPRPVDTVLVSPGGYPRDLDLYQAQKSVSSAAKIVEPGGNVVLVAEAREGAGSALFVQWMTEAPTLDDVIRRARAEFVMGGHKAYQFARAMQHAHLFVYSSLPQADIRKLKMQPLASVTALEALLAGSRRLAVLPQGTLSLARLAPADTIPTPNGW
ncbi:MAG: hypothetical protein COY42_20735 [Armatimonadetes bacterium CG_4_10_14_0_8_um_filter_66_14]|nr:MAG: hypothetical protein COY42_20735 [Armatimonadetes bacterium CG_4_10_14_0_8_um_filter_66_14]